MYKTIATYWRLRGRRPESCAHKRNIGRKRRVDDDDERRFRKWREKRSDIIQIGSPRALFTVKRQRYIYIFIYNKERERERVVPLKADLCWMHRQGFGNSLKGNIFLYIDDDDLYNTTVTEQQVCRYCDIFKKYFKYFKKSQSNAFAKPLRIWRGNLFSTTSFQ